MEINNIQIRSNNIYPEIVGATNDPRVVMILKDLLSSRQGEIAGVLQYFYQSRIAKQVDENIAEIFEEISIVEMEHAQLLMDAIVEFGGIPKYINSKNQPFTTSYLNYDLKLKDMLENNIADEQQAIKEYTMYANMVTNPSLKALLLRIAEDEKLHLQTFKNLQNTIRFLSV